MAQTQTEKKDAPRGRKDAEKQETVLNPESVETKIEHLITLKRKVETATSDYSDAIKAVAETSGFLASQVRKFVTARAGERFEEKKREATQFVLLFDEVGE